jgi:hypothetical protein
MPQPEFRKSKLAQKLRVRRAEPAPPPKPEQIQDGPPAHVPPVAEAASTQMSVAWLTFVGAVVASVITALGVIAAAVITPTVKGTDPKVGNAQSNQSTVRTRIVNTGGVGVFYRSAPTTRSDRSRGPLEGDEVAVVCQERNGQPMTNTDHPTPGQPRGWPVWDRVPDGRWFTDLWSDLPKSPGPTPPRGLPTC